MGKAVRRLLEANEKLDGALEATPTWVNEHIKAAPAHTLGEWAVKGVAYIKSFRLTRALQRYTIGRGNLLAGGIAYSAMFAIAGALALAFTVFSAVLGGNKQMFNSLVEHINRVLPSILITEDHSSGLLDPRALIIDNPVNIVSVVSALVLLWSAISLMSNLRRSIQVMFGIAKLPRNVVVDKLLDLSAFVILGASVLLSTGAMALVQFFAPQVFGFLQIPASWGDFTLWSISLGVSLVVDILVFVFLFRIMSGVRAPRLDLFYGAFLGSVASGIVRYAGTAAVGSVADNPLLAPFAAIITVLVWVNLIARITLISAAFAANPPEQLDMKPAYFEHAKETPNYVTKSVLDTLAWAHDPVTGVVAAQKEEAAE